MIKQKHIYAIKVCVYPSAWAKEMRAIKTVMKKYINIFIIAIVFSSCAVLYRGNIDKVNRCAEILRSYGYTGGQTMTAYVTQSAWNYPIYHKVWYFMRGDDYAAMISWEAGDTDKDLVTCWFNYERDKSLDNELKSIGVASINCGAGWSFKKPWEW